MYILLSILKLLNNVQYHVRTGGEHAFKPDMKIKVIFMKHEYILKQK